MKFRRFRKGQLVKFVNGSDNLYKVLEVNVKSQAIRIDTGRKYLWSWNNFIHASKLDKVLE